MPVFAHLANADTYLPGLWDFTRDADARATWAARLRTHLDDTIRHAHAAEPAPIARHLERIAPEWRAIIDRLDDTTVPPPGRTVLELVAARDALFRGEPVPADGAPVPPGPFDVYAAVKQTSNAWAIPRYSGAVEAIEALDDDAARLEHTLVALLAGNVLDVASAEVAEAARAGEPAIEAIVRRVRERPPALDGRAAFVDRLTQLRAGSGHARSGRARSGHPGVLIFADNAGMDFVLGVVPFARELLRLDCRVVVAANERPALNDVTAAEAAALLEGLAAEDAALAEARARGDLHVVSTGNGTPGIDLRRVSEAVNAAESDLVVFVGQGRAIESTWTAVLDRPSLRVATLKSPLVAGRLGLSVFDGVVALREAGETGDAVDAGEAGESPVE